MKIIIPMAGEGQRFKNAGYKENKAVLPIVYRKTGEKCPMVICSVKDLPGINENGDNIAFIMRNFHIDLGIDSEIRKWYKQAAFFVTDKLTEGQACTCLLAKSFIDADDQLLIAACDNGIEYDKEKFDRLREECDVIVFTYRNDPKVDDNPDAFGWVVTDGEDTVKGVSVKHRLSDTPRKDHAIVATFWYRRGDIFIQAAEKMIKESDRINNEFYVDETIKHAIELGYRVKVFEVERFLNYGTPDDYENYMKMIDHFKGFIQSEYYMGE